MMKSNFLNLPSSAVGDARRHVPFRSIINKHISILFVLSFVFSILFSYVHPVAALADPQPEYDPVYNTEIIRLADYVDNELTPDQQDVFYIMFGAYLVAQGAMQNSLIEDPYTTQDGVIGWLKSCGIQIYNSAIVQNALMSPALLVQNGIQDLVDFAMGIAYKAGLIQDKVTFINDVMSSDYYFMPFNKGIQLGINQVLAFNGGLYNWQFEKMPMSTTRSYDANSTLISTVGLFVRGENVTNDTKSPAFSQYIPFFNTYTNILISINSNMAFICDDVGNVAGSFSLNEEPYTSYKFGYVDDYNYVVSRPPTDYPSKQYLFSPTAPIVPTTIINGSGNDIFTWLADNAVFFNTPGTTTSQKGRYAKPFIADFIKHVYIGLSWDDKTEIFNSTDLNFTDDILPYYLQVQNNYLLDLKGLIEDLINVTQLQPVVIDNIYDSSGVQTVPVTQQVSVTVQLPDSGIGIPTDLFSPLTKEGGYISYLWYMTKPLVQYTSDLVQTLVFPDDIGEGFDVTGPGVIVFGVISLGLIGGLVVKCLL